LRAPAARGASSVLVVVLVVLVAALALLPAAVAGQECDCFNCRLDPCENYGVW
jgi:hypothetical protein